MGFFFHRNPPALKSLSFLFGTLKFLEYFKSCLSLGSQEADLGTRIGVQVVYLGHASRKPRR